MIDAVDPGIKLYIRNKRPEELKQFGLEKTLLFVHGATQPSEATEYIAQHGWMCIWSTCVATADPHVRRKWISQQPTILLSLRLMWL